MNSESTESSEDFPWWRNPFIPKGKRLWLEFLSSNGLLHEPHDHVPHSQLMQMWRDFVEQKRNDRPEDQDNDNEVPSNPFVSEFNKLWQDFLKENIFILGKHEHFSHDQFLDMWGEFFVNDLTSGLNMVSTSAVSASPKFGPKGPPGFLAKLKEFLDSRKDPKPSGPKGFLAWWLQVRGKFPQSGSAGSSAKMPRPKFQAAMVGNPGVAVSEETEEAASAESTLPWWKNPFIPAPVRLWGQFMEEFANSTAANDNVTDAQLTSKFFDFLADQGVIPEGAAAENATLGDFFEWWFGSMTWGMLSPAPLSGIAKPSLSVSATASMEPARVFPRESFLAWWSEFQRQKAEPDPDAGAGVMRDLQERFLNWWTSRMSGRFAQVGAVQASAIGISQTSFIDLFCSSLLTGTYDPRFPQPVEGKQPQPAPALAQPAGVQAEAVDTADRAAQRVLRSVPLIDGFDSLCSVCHVQETESICPNSFRPFVQHLFWKRVGAKCLIPCTVYMCGNVSSSC